jgi:ketosteroid isomerase-like protein
MRRFGGRSWAGPLAAALLATAVPARAWDDVGHRVVAAIAWENLSPEGRERAVKLLLAAPADADLASLLPQDGRPPAERQRELFLKAATWPDIVRDQKPPHAERFAKYHHGPWHYIAWYWEPAAGAPRDRPDLPPDRENVVERLEIFDTSLADASRPAADRGVELAWVLHLIGDIHQPLHAASRVTATEPHGDHGGNDFKLKADGSQTLHWFWDSILTTARPRPAAEADAAYVDRLATDLAHRFPKEGLAGRLQSGQFEAWAKAGYETTKARVYPSSLKRGKAPDAAYRKLALGIAEPAIALAGYRLADTLMQIFAAAGPELTDDERQISQLEREWIAALVTGNGEWLAQHLSESSIHVTADGAVLTKDQLVAAVTAGDRRMSLVVPRETRIKTYGHTAIATALTEGQGTAPGADGKPAPTQGAQRGTHVWVRYADVWQMVASQATPVVGP